MTLIRFHSEVIFLYFSLLYFLQSIEEFDFFCLLLDRNEAKAKAEMKYNLFYLLNEQ